MSMNSSVAACRVVSVNPKKILDPLVGFVDLVPVLRSSQHNLAAGEDKKDDLRILHPEYQAREQFWLVAAVLGTLLDSLAQESLKLDGKANVVGADNILDGELRELHFLVTDLLELLCIGERGGFTIIL